ncbi:hypothetical protein Hanom_Chr14g01272621 [Helianthus anomalus]
MMAEKPKTTRGRDDTVRVPPIVHISERNESKIISRDIQVTTLSKSSGLLHGLHIYANFYDPGNCFHVTACGVPFWGIIKRCDSCRLCRYCWCIFLLLFI